MDLVWAAILPILAALIAPGCKQVEVIPAPGHRLGTVVARWHRPGSCWSVPTTDWLCQLGLEGLARRDPCAAFAELERGIPDARPDPARMLALAELADQTALAMGPFEKDGAMAWSRDAAVYAAFCLSDLGRDPGADATWCAACEVHNRATARCLRLARTADAPRRGGWPGRLASAGIATGSDVPEWTSMGFTAIEPAMDRIVTGMKPKGRRAGLGVPLIVRRSLDDAEAVAWKPFGPESATFAATAVVRPGGSPSSWREQPVEMMLLDPMRHETLDLGGRTFPMAADLTTPMASRLAQAPIRNYEYLGVFDPEFYAERAGVYAVDPYQPGKVPVVLVHGLWSSPHVWVPMLDALRGDPALRASYQFWVVLYPSGYSLPTAALSVRRSLREIRRRFDPGGTDPALDRMVILGKSTGGQTSRLLVQSSGEALWDAIFTRPIDQLRAEPSLRAELAETLFFEPEPYIGRTIFVTTSHRGGNLARQPWVDHGADLIRRNNPLRATWAELHAANGPGVFRPAFRHDPPGSVDGMRADSPLLKAIDAQPIAPGVAYHSIIATIHPGLPRETMTDGLVRYTSAHLDGAASETIVSSTHVTVEADPEVIAEVRRILMENRNEAVPSGPQSVSGGFAKAN
ncbi:MAG: esterase/lipase family protein [Isosphaeraceae bacterium]